MSLRCDWFEDPARAVAIVLEASVLRAQAMHRGTEERATRRIADAEASMLGETMLSRRRLADAEVESHL